VLIVIAAINKQKLKKLYFLPQFKFIIPLNVRKDAIEPINKIIGPFQKE
jgi:hypothetical protein